LNLNKNVGREKPSRLANSREPERKQGWQKYSAVTKMGIATQNRMRTNFPQKRLHHCNKWEKKERGKNLADKAGKTAVERKNTPGPERGKGNGRTGEPQGESDGTNPEASERTKLATRMDVIERIKKRGKGDIKVNRGKFYRKGERGCGKREGSWGGDQLAAEG